MSKTITINVEEEIDKEFRKTASQRYGKRKGYLGKAITEAMKDWVRKRNADLEAKALELLKNGINAQRKWKFDRGELHERV